MPRAFAFVAVGLILAAGAAWSARQVTEVSAQAPHRVLEMSLGSVPGEHACTTLAAWRDASDPLFFATGATSRLDEQELAAGTIVPMIQLRAAWGGLRLFVLGIPSRAGLQFTTAGWRPRWPFC